MSARIPQSFIDDLLDRVDIVELVDARVKLKKSGKNYSACCPFHDEKTPSFTVTQDKQFYYCFGCGASGNAIGFLMDYDRLSFPEAVEQLARLSGLEVPREQRQASSQELARERDRKTIYSLLEAAASFYQQALRQHPAKGHAVGYLQRRGLSGEVARDFGLGFAPPGWDNLLRALGTEPDDQRLLIESGMLINRDDNHKLYDRFRDRIMFPIRDVRGRVIGFGGRVLGDGKPKYLNSPESPVFHKGEELYGLYEARQANSQLKRVMVVEGYMDVVALSQFGISYGVATLGTACREDHLKKAFKYTQEVVFCFDGDNAGRMAARRALENSLPVMTDGRQVRFLFLPDGEDPDTLVRQIGAKKFTHLIEHALPLEEFFFDALCEDLDVRSMEGRARLSKLAAPMLNRLPKGVYRELMFSSLAKRTGLEVHTLLELVEEVPLQPLAPPDGPDREPAVVDETPPPPDYEMVYDSGAQPVQRQAHSIRAGERVKLSTARLLTLLLFHYPELAPEAADLETEHLAAETDGGLDQFLELLHLLRQRPHFTTAQIIGHLQGTGDEAAGSLAELSAGVGELIRRAQQLQGYDPRREFREAIQRLQSQVERRKAEALLGQLRGKPFAELSAEEKQLYRETLARFVAVPPTVE
ncbi:DNA primase [Gilvimarinus sp. F26214L]|uniref:DNA primase n=1 Tax=Gilvimarinus sp. DZF01 TaxID=3461371 RepID=UPI004045D021